MTCYTNHGHRVHDSRGVHVECDDCGYQFADIDNTGGLPPHDDETDASEPSEGTNPTELDGFRCHFIARHGTDFTVWTYRPIS